MFDEATLDLLNLPRAREAAIEWSDTLPSAVLCAVIAPFTAYSPVGPRRPHSVNCKQNLDVLQHNHSDFFTAAKATCYHDTMGVDHGGIRGCIPLRPKWGVASTSIPPTKEMSKWNQYSTILKSILQNRLYHT